MLNLCNIPRQLDSDLCNVRMFAQSHPLVGQTTDTYAACGRVLGPSTCAAAPLRHVWITDGEDGAGRSAVCVTYA
jgi:hypothetical protein